MLQVHGLDVDQDTYETPAGYMQDLSDERVEEDYYYHVLLACAQAVRVLAMRSDVDAERLGVCGGSQGAFLSLATAALCPEIKAVTASICFYANWPFRDQMARLNRDQLNGQTEPLPPVDPTDVRPRRLSYYDAMNLATLVRAPTLMSACLCDVPSPPSTVWATYRNLATETKELHWSAGTNHDKMMPFEKAGFRWMTEHLGRRSDYT